MRLILYRSTAGNPSISTNLSWQKTKYSKWLYSKCMEHSMENCENDISKNAERKSNSLSRSWCERKTSRGFGEQGMN